jgi:hypothetical protein
VRYVHLQASSVDVTLLEDATRRGKTPKPPSFYAAVVPLPPFVKHRLIEYPEAQQQARAKQGGT